MKNVWKGLVVGAFTGAGVGLVLDVLDRGAQRVAAVGDVVGDVVEEAVQHVPQVATRVRQGVSETVSRVHDADIPEQLKEAASATKRKVSKAAADGNEAIGSLLS
jgi:sRNA-binding protein